MRESAPHLYESFSLWGSGVCLVSVREHDHDRFFVAGSVLTASVDPFTVAVSVGADRDALASMRRGAPWALSILGAAHVDLVRTLTTGTREERLAALAQEGAEASPEGPLWLPDALVTLWCETRATLPVHDQEIVVGDVVRGSLHTDTDPLLRWNRDFRTITDLR